MADRVKALLHVRRVPPGNERMNLYDTTKLSATDATATMASARYAIPPRGYTAKHGERPRDDGGRGGRYVRVRDGVRVLRWAQLHERGFRREHREQRP